MFFKTIFCALFTGMLCNSAANAQESIDLKKIPSSAELFARGLVSTGMSERDFALSPDGNEIYYTVQVPSSMFHVIVMM